MSFDLENLLTVKKIIGALCLLVIVAIFMYFFNEMVVDIPAGKYAVKQSFGTGELTVYNQPGWKPQMMGDITWYDRSNQLWFSPRKEKDHVVDHSLPIRFSDGGTAKISGSLRYDLPDGDKLLSLHKRYKSAQAIERELIIPVIQKSIQLSGPTMTSKESAAARRNDLLTIIEDQIVNGVYKTTVQRIQVDDITSESGKKWVDVLRPVEDKNAPNGIARAEVSPIQSAGISISAVAITEITYDTQVEAAIAKQYELEMQVQTSKTAAITAAQNAQTAEAEGKAAKTRAEWAAKEAAEKEIVAAERDKKIAETEAEKKLRVAELDKQTAQNEKDAAILRAEGEATAKAKLAEAQKKQMDANGMLEQKLAVYREVNLAWAEAVKSIKLPSVVMGGGNSQGGSSEALAQILNLIGAKQAADMAGVGLDMSIKKQ